jgi:hypothetical protein
VNCTIIPVDIVKIKYIGFYLEHSESSIHFISAQLHRGIGSSNTFFNYVVWESAERFKQAFNRPKFRSSMADVLPNITMSPHLFKKVAVPGICVE